LKIEFLTPSQELLIPQIHKYWLDRATAPIDKNLASIAISDLYKLEKRQPPKFIFVDSPMTGMVANLLLENMSPATQTIEQINDDKNQEIKRIRIERFGWQKYLEAVNADILDEGDRPI
jgi:hypothetical protein